MTKRLGISPLDVLIFIGLALNPITAVTAQAQAQARRVALSNDAKRIQEQLVAQYAAALTRERQIRARDAETFQVQLATIERKKRQLEAQLATTVAQRSDLRQELASVTGERDKLARQLADKDEALRSEVAGYEIQVGQALARGDPEINRSLSTIASSEGAQGYGALANAYSTRVAGDAQAAVEFAALLLAGVQSGSVSLTEAITAWERALRLDPGYAQGWQHLSRLYRDSGRYAEALGAIDTLITLGAPTSLLAIEQWENKATILTSLERHQEALAELNRARQAINRLGQGDAATSFAMSLTVSLADRLARSYIKQADFASAAAELRAMGRAIADYDRVWEAPSEVESWIGSQKLLEAELNHLIGNSEAGLSAGLRAQTAYQTLYDAYGEAAYLSNVAAALSWQGKALEKANPKESIRAFRESLEINRQLRSSDPNDLRIWKNEIGDLQSLAWVYAHLGQRQETEKYSDEGLEQAIKFSSAQKNNEQGLSQVVRMAAGGTGNIIIASQGNRATSKYFDGALPIISQVDTSRFSAEFHVLVSSFYSNVSIAESYLKNASESKRYSEMSVESARYAHQLGQSSRTEDNLLLWLGSHQSRYPTASGMRELCDLARNVRRRNFSEVVRKFFERSEEVRRCR